MHSYDYNNNETSKAQRRNNHNESSDDDDDVYYQPRSVSVSKVKETKTQVTKYNGKNQGHRNGYDEGRSEAKFQWYEISVPSVDSDEIVKARFFNGPISLNDMVGFNNTGNICTRIFLVFINLPTVEFFDWSTFI